MNSDAQTIVLIAGVAVPILVGLLAKASAPSGLKAILNAALTAAGAVLAQTIPAGAFHWHAFFVAWAATWVVSVASHFGFYKPVGVSGAVQSSTATIGLG